MKIMIFTLFLLLTFSLISSPKALPLSYAESINLISNQEEMYQFLVHHRSNEQSYVSILFNVDDIGLAKLEVFDILGKLLYSADVYLSENSCDYIMDSNEFQSSASNPGILLVKLSTKGNQYLKKFTLLI